MSRSYKAPWILASGGEGSGKRWFKRYANRVARRHWWNTRGLKRRLSQTWNISDWHYYWDDPKARRK